MTLFWWGLLGGIIGSTIVLGFYIYSQIPEIRLRLLLVKNVRDQSYIRVTYETLDEPTEFYIIEKNSRNLKNRFYERTLHHDFQEISMRGGDVRFDKFVDDCKGLNIYSDVTFSKELSLGFGQKYLYVSSSQFNWHESVVES